MGLQQWKESLIVSDVDSNPVVVFWGFFGGLFFSFYWEVVIVCVCGDVAPWYSRGMCYPVCVMVHMKEPLLLTGKNSSCSGGSRFPLSLSEWSFTICLVPYNRK